MNLVLKSFQRRHVDAIVDIVNDTAAKIGAAPDDRRKIAASQGCILLEAPTGSGKTLTIATALMRLRVGVPLTAIKTRPVLWFWFAPFADLVDQTIAAIRTETDLTVRDPRDDREVGITRPGDVFVSTWQSVAARDPKKRKVREDGESLPSIDTLIDRLRDEGYLIGAVIDEAHHNFKTAPQALSFYAEVLAPDFTIMATATPDDADLAQFQRFAGIREVNRLAVSRDEVVAEGLNKDGVKAFYFKASGPDEQLLDYDEIAIYSAVERHREIQRALSAEGIALAPLLLVQVDNYKESVDTARQILQAAGVQDDAIAVHTADEPDKNLRAIADDETKEALIFKMAVATGFDVPRAWTLVSLRSSRSSSFGLQVIGRIMRVHPRVQLHPPSDRTLLGYGHVFLSRIEAQGGLRSAAELIKAITTEIHTVTDHVQIVEISTGRVALTDPNGGFTEILMPDATATEQKNVVIPSGLKSPTRVGEFVGALFSMVNEAEARIAAQRASTKGQRQEEHLHRYPFRAELGAPTELDRESMPADYAGLEQCIVQRIQFDEHVLALVTRERGSVQITVEDLFIGGVETLSRKFRFSMDRVEAAAQLAFRFNNALDPRDMKRALVQRLRKDLEAGGHAEQSEVVLRRTVDIALFLNPSLISDACKECLSTVVEVHKGAPVPGALESKIALDVAEKSVYAAFGPRLNAWERPFAEILDADDTGTVLWWMKNVENTNWACRIVRASGRFYFPDFVIGVAGRKKPDKIALAEVKERIESSESAEKVRSEHKSYGSAIMVTRNEKTRAWEVVDYIPSLGRNIANRRFNISELRYLS